MAEIHYFDVRIAQLYGVNCAVILQNIWHWIKKNEANGQNFYDGTYWTYNSTKAFSELFPYLSRKQIETALNKLREEQIIMTGNYNALKYDRTLWYAITKKGKSILLGGEMENPEKGNGNPPEGEPIPDINTDSKTSDNKPYKIIIDYLNQKAGTSYRPTTKATQQHINARLADGFKVEDFITVIDKKCAEWKGTDMAGYLRPETLFGTKFESYLNAPVRKGNGRKEPVPGWMEHSLGQAELEAIQKTLRDDPPTVENNPELAARAERLKAELSGGMPNDLPFRY